MTGDRGGGGAGDAPSGASSHGLIAGAGPAVPRATFAPGDVVASRYCVLRFVARGGMGEVYEVDDLEIRGTVALKMVRPEAATDETAIDRFRREHG